MSGCEKKKKGIGNRTYASAKPGMEDDNADAAASGEMRMDVLGCEKDGSRVLLRGWCPRWEGDAGSIATLGRDITAYFWCT